MIHIDIEIKNRNKIKEFFHKLLNWLENFIFFIMQKLPERFIPTSVMRWLDHYTDRRINQLKQEQIKATWERMYLEAAVNQIHNKEKAPTE